MRRLALTIYLLISVLSFSRAQMWNGTDSLYGNEWIRYDQTYFKIAVAADGIYRIPYAALSAAGIPADALDASQYQLWWLGQEQPLYTSTNEMLSEGDFLEFYGRKNRSELDRHLFQDPDNEMLNPWYSLFTDTSAYFLTWVSPGEPTRRYEQVENELTNLPAKEEWFWGEAEVVYSNQYNKKGYRVAGETISLSEFEGDGFSRGSNSAHDFNFNTPGVYAAGPEGSLHLRMLSNANAAGHHLQVRINDQLRAEEEYSGSEMRIFDFPMAPGALGTAANIKVNGLNNNDKYAVAGARLRYPRQFSLGNASFFQLGLPAGSGARYLELSGLGGNQPPVLLDLTNELRLAPVEEGGLWKVKLPAAAGERNLVVSRAILQVDNLAPVAFSDYSEAQAEFIIISNERLFDDGQGNNRVQEYADYRATPDGGGYSTIVVEIGQLYDQFAYGVQRTPIGIRNFGHYIKRNWDNPRYVLLIGKGRTFNTTRTASALADPKNSTFYLPTFGYPGSDNLLLAKPGSNVPVIPTGRIAASDGDDVRMYLEKAIGFGENARVVDEESRAWKKEVLHLGGGGPEGEKNLIRSLLSQMEAVLVGSPYGANVTNFYKTSSDPIQQSQSGVIVGRINEGASVITFFGHASFDGFDFSIDDPSRYQNFQRYPTIFSLGCHSGDIHLDSRTVGENFLFQEDKGAIAFLATVGLGFITDLGNLARKYYARLGNEDYGKGIGDIMKHCIEDYEGSSSISLQSLIQQFTLHGDPALAINPFPLPDFQVNRASVQFEPDFINSRMNTLELSFDIANLGKALEDSLDIHIEREFPDGVKFLALEKRIAAPSYKQSMSVQLPVQGERAVGFNRFYITLDPDERIVEGPLPIAEQNNQLTDALGKAGIERYIFSNGAIPAHPWDFGITGEANGRLKATTADLFAPEQRFVFEIDTTALFNSPFKKRGEVLSRGGLLEWPLPFSQDQERVYYWRVSPDSTNLLGYQWAGSSFVHLSGSPSGWNQSHFYQFAQNRFTNMKFPEETRKLKFIDDIKTVRVRNGVHPLFPLGIDINNETFYYIPWDNPVRRGIYVCVLDSLSADPWINNPPGDYGSSLETAWAYWASYPFWTNTAEARAKAIHFLRDTIPPGNYVIVYTVQWENTSYEPEEWEADSLELGTTLFDVLEQQGASLIRSTAQTGARPYILIYKKDDTTFPVFEQLGALDEGIEKVLDIQGIWDEGAMRTPFIGPAREWASVQWKVEDIEPHDQWRIEVHGVRADTTSQLLFVSGSPSLDTTLAWVDARQYPYLEMRFFSRDTLLRSSPQLPFWRVLYQSLPDAALNPKAGLTAFRDTLQEGEQLILDVPIVNLMETGMDSLLVRYSIVSSDNSRIDLSRRFRPLQGGDTLIAGISVDTRGLSGAQRLTIEANPGPEQAELTYVNNVGLSSFFVKKDPRNPILQVTFDGQPIMDGDIVSARPAIVISLRDENPFLRLDDTAYLKVLLQYPDENDVRHIPHNSGLLQFYPPSDSGPNQARLEFMPVFDKSGAYVLIVQGEDASGNQSGQFDYKVRFEVITESRISNVLNYPNPFSTSTQFVYTLTGSEPPAFFSIQIMTISGRIVREITQDEIGPLKIGAHRTEYAWDGRDEFGDKLANGVYLYRIMAKDKDGREFGAYSNAADRYFRNGLGKMVILR